MSLIARCTLAATLAVTPLSAAEPRDRAAAAFDRGVQLYEQAEYAEAARAFLEADAAVASDDALDNALTAARRTQDYLLVVQVAERVTTRSGAGARLVTKARDALADAAAKLAVLELSCEPDPCQAELDQKPAKAGQHYVLPGTHVLTASGPDGATAQERVQLQAGTRSRIVLYPTQPAEQARKAAVTQERAPTQPPSRDRTDSDKPLPPEVFWVGAGLTVVGAAVTTWSGLDALAAKNDLGDEPTTDEVDDVKGKVVRTDVILAVTALVGAGTAYAGFALVDWEGGSATASASPQGGFVQLTHRF